MSATIDVRDAVTQLTANMAGKKQIDFATRVALTRTAQLAAISSTRCATSSAARRRTPCPACSCGRPPRPT